MKTKDDKRMITSKEAISLLNEDKQILTFRSVPNTLIGADHDRDELIKDINKYADTLQIGGELCRKMKHGLVLYDNVGALFIETNEEKLNTFDPIKKSEQ